MHSTFSDPATSDATGTPRGAIVASFILGTVGASGFTLLPMTLPALAGAFGLSNGSVGLVSTMELTGVTGGALLAGLLSRRFDSRMQAVVVTGLLTLCALATMLVDSIVLLTSVRFVDGIMAGYALSLAYSTLMTTRRVDRNYALLAICPLIYGMIGFAVLPKFEGLVGWHASFIVLSVSDAIGFVAAFFLCVRLTAQDKPLSFIETLPNLRGAMALFSVVFYYAGLCAIYAFSFNMGIQSTGSPALAGSALSASQFVGIGGCIVAALIAGRMDRRLAILTGFVITVAGILCLMFSLTTIGFFTGLLAINFAWNFLAGSHISAVGSMDERGSAAAFLAVAINVGAAVGPLLGFAVKDEHYGLLQSLAVAMILVALGLIGLAIRGRRQAAGGHPVLEEEVLLDV
ncbi:MFS transporter [Acidimangrovimonas sediminis]|uniref:MFS transporter n=1 Tax=Acidimangrovimonas sediminis TaxID=2056283 RepID=UPI000C7F9C80|nr:MFS transporter [Acidimangrovimonas sediminis]